MKFFILFLCSVCFLHAQGKVSVYSGPDPDASTADSTVIRIDSSAGDTLGVYTLETVVVKAARTEKPSLSLPYTADVIAGAEIERIPRGRTLQPLFESFTGMIVNDRQNPSLGEKITIRGAGGRAAFGIRGIKILLDGIPLTMPDGLTQITSIDLSSVGKAELLHGPGPALYGNSSGGVINLHTESPSAAPFSAAPSLTAGSYGLRKYNLKLSGTLGNSAYLISGTKADYEGFREHSSSSINLVNTIFTVNINSRLSLRGIFNYVHAPYLLNPSSLNLADASADPSSVREFIRQQGAGERVTHWQGGVKLNYSSGASEFETVVYYLNRSLLNPIPGRLINLNRRGGGVRSVFFTPFIILSNRINFTAGADIELQQDVRSEYENLGVSRSNLHPKEVIPAVRKGAVYQNQDENVIVTAPFVLLEFPYNNFIFSAGIRLDRYKMEVIDRLYTDSTDFSGEKRLENLSPSAGILYNFNNLSKLYVNYSTSFQTPSAAELSNRPGSTGGFNPSLNPEEIQSFELGYDQFFPYLRLRISAAVYHMNFSELLIPYQVSGFSDEVYYRNAGNAANTGGEVRIQFSPSDRLIFTASYTGMNFRFTDYVLQISGTNRQLKGFKVPGIPPSYLYTGITYQPFSNLWIAADVKYSAEYFTDDFNGSNSAAGSAPEDYTNEAYLLTGIKGGFTIPVSDELLFSPLALSMLAGIDNLFNVRYNGSVVPNAAGGRYFEPAAGRTFYLTLTAEL